MKVIDAHCDVLLKLQLRKRASFESKKALLHYREAPELQANLQKLKEGKVKVQFFAIFIDTYVPSDEKWQHALEQIDLFYTEVLGKNPEMKHIRHWQALHSLKDGEIGAVLTLEGADAFGNDITKLHHLYRLGVLSIGLTWNYANLCADGIQEPRGAGLSLFGKEVVALNNAHHVLTDVSHLSLAGFWDVMELAHYPIASHSNARAICDHPRNLADDQIKALFAKNGMMHVVFAAAFIKKDAEVASISDLIHHIEHLCELGGEKQIGFGSDFDGISSGQMPYLDHSGHFPYLINELLKRYSERQVRGLAYANFMNHLPGEHPL